jgi:signal transduction histidine kinase
MTSRRRFLVSRGGDLLVLALLVFGELEVWLGLDRWRWQAALFVPLWTLPLLLRRRFTLAMSVAIPAVMAAESFFYEPATEQDALFIAGLATFLLLGLHEDRVRAVTAGAVGYGLLLTLLVNGATDSGPSDLLLFAIFCFGPLAAGIAVRERTQRTTGLQARTRELEHSREEAADVAATEERARIARELHDVIAQAIGAMTVQAGAARVLLRTDPEQARRPIEAVEATGREALAETRRLLGILRDTNGPTLAPQPGLGLLDLLVDAARRKGLDAAVSVDGEGRVLPPGLDLAAYRIVQSGLRQASKRPDATHAHVLLRWGADALEIVIDDDGDVSNGPGGDDAGELAALRERLALYDGTIETGCTENGCSTVRARLPLEAAS